MSDHIHDPAAIRTAWDDDEEATRIIRRVGAALNSGRDKAVVDVVLSETDALRREMASDRAHLEQRTEALSRTIATKDALQAKIATGLRLLGGIIDSIEGDCQPYGGMCHGYDTTDEDECAVVADLAMVRAALGES